MRSDASAHRKRERKYLIFILFNFLLLTQVGLLVSSRLSPHIIRPNHVWRCIRRSPGHIKCVRKAKLDLAVISLRMFAGEKKGNKYCFVVFLESDIRIPCIWRIALANALDSIFNNLTRAHAVAKKRQNESSEKICMTSNKKHRTVAD